MDRLKKAIGKTKNYASKYGQKLNDKQLFLRLISQKIYKFSEVEGQGVKNKKNGEWQKKVVLAKRLIKEHLSKIRGVKMVAITGSVAAEAARKNEDIDLLIIIKEDELWWWRLYLRFYVRWHKIPHRRFGEKERKNEFCFNLWLDETNLSIPVEKRGLKNAMDLVMMKVIWNEDESYQKFLRENEWVKKYLATGYRERTKAETRNERRDFREKKSFSYWKIINRILFWGQYFYMWSKQRRKLKNIEKGRAFFHKDA